MKILKQSSSDQAPTKHPPSTDEVPQKYRSSSVEVQDLINVLNGEMSRKEIQLALELKHEGNFRENYLEPALTAGLIRISQRNRQGAGQRCFARSSF